MAEPPACPDLRHHVVCCITTVGVVDGNGVAALCGQQGGCGPDATGSASDEKNRFMEKLVLQEW